MKIAYCLGLIAALAALSSPALSQQKQKGPPAVSPAAGPSGQELLNILAACSAKSPEGIPGRYNANRSGRTWLHVSKGSNGFVVKTKNDVSILVLTEVNGYSVENMTITVRTLATTWTATYNPATKTLPGTLPGGTLVYDLTAC